MPGQVACLVQNQSNVNPTQKKKPEIWGPTLLNQDEPNSNILRTVYRFLRTLVTNAVESNNTSSGWIVVVTRNRWSMKSNHQAGANWKHGKAIAKIHIIFEKHVQGLKFPPLPQFEKMPFFPRETGCYMKASGVVPFFPTALDSAVLAARQSTVSNLPGCWA